MRTLALGFVFSIGFAASCVSAWAETAGEWLKKGVEAEQASEATSAINYYKKSIAGAKGEDAIAAESQYRLAELYFKEKKNAEAVVAFQKVIENYPKQEDWVAKAKEMSPVWLKYDDGQMDLKRSAPAGGHAIRFKRPAEGDWYVDQVQIYASRFGLLKAPEMDFFIYIADEKMKKGCKLTKPYSTFAKAAERWYTIKIQPVKVPENFYVAFVFNQTSMNGVNVGIDKVTEPNHSQEAIPGVHIREMTGTLEWMIRARITRIPIGRILELSEKELQ